MTSGIYKIRNLINGHIYIGSAVNIDGRWSAHISTLKNGKHHSSYLQRAWSKYGADTFEFSIIEECSKEDLLMREQHFIDTLSPEYNVCKVAGNWLGMRHTPETLARMSMAAKNMSDEHRAKISKALKGVKRPPFSIETREKMSAWQKGRTLSPEHRSNMSKANKGKKLPPFSIEHRAKLSEAAKECWAKRRRETK